ESDSNSDSECDCDECIALQIQQQIAQEEQECVEVVQVIDSNGIANSDEFMSIDGEEFSEPNSKNQELNLSSKGILLMSIRIEWHSICLILIPIFSYPLDPLQSNQFDVCKQ